MKHFVVESTGQWQGKDLFVLLGFMRIEQKFKRFSHLENSKVIKFSAAGLKGVLNLLMGARNVQLLNFAVFRTVELLEIQKKVIQEQIFYYESRLLF